MDICGGGERIKVACVSSGFVCEYLKPDLSFADGYEVLTLLALLVHNFTSTNVQCANYLKADLSFDDGCKVLSLLALLVQKYKYRHLGSLAQAAAVASAALCQQYLHFCTSKASKLSTSIHLAHRRKLQQLVLELSSSKAEAHVC
jgi:hypothetical protein